MNDLNEEKCEKKDEGANAQMFSSFVFTAESLEAAYAEASSRLLQEVETRKQKKLDAVTRPKITFWRWLLGLLLPLFLDAVAVFTVMELSLNGWLILPAILLITFAFVKPSVILFVLIYQKIAPKRLRCSCRFEPTCSAYMLLAIEKYGFFRGFAKGINRLSRCRPPNGGVDYP